MKQQINVQADYTIEIDAKYSKEELNKIVSRNLLRAFPNNSRTLNSFAFQEEAEIYGNKETNTSKNLLNAFARLFKLPTLK